MSVFAKVLLALASIFLSGGRSDRDSGEPRSFGREISGILDIVFIFAIVSFLVWKLGLFTIKPIEARGYDAIGPFIVALLMLGLKALLFVLLPTFLICMALRGFDSIGARLVVYGVVAMAGAGIYFTAKKNAEAEAQQAYRKVEAAEASRRQTKSEAESMEQAREQAVLREAEDLKNSRARLLELRNQARDRWRADVQAAGAFGAEGEFPPMLRVFQDGPYEVNITNAGPTRACVKLVRTIRKPGTEVYLRCPADLFRECKDIPSRATVKFYMQFDERSPACREQRYEFRVGHPLKPEPSWWSVSALAYIDENPMDMREPEISNDILAVRGEIAKIEKWLAR